MVLLLNIIARFDPKIKMIAQTKKNENPNHIIDFMIEN